MCIARSKCILVRGECFLVVTTHCACCTRADEATCNRNHAEPRSVRQIGDSGVFRHFGSVWQGNVGQTIRGSNDDDRDPGRAIVEAGEL